MKMKTAEEWADLWRNQIPRNPQTFSILPRPGDPTTLEQLACKIQADALRHAAWLNVGGKSVLPEISRRLLEEANQLDPQA